MAELLGTGKTRAKITGFTSKAGNLFDACLKFEEDRIAFDFDNPGEKQNENKEMGKEKYEGTELPPYDKENGTVQN